ncbi:MAG: DUF4835 family protein [Ignavibacteriales bacterium]|nr:DUF4835 family protein [Ignavibacteriales bacterium]
MKTIIIFAVLSFCLTTFIQAQEIDCDVTIDLEPLTTSEAKDNLNDFVQQLKNYINGHRWTQEDRGDQRIKCAINISFQGSEGEHGYKAQVFIGSQRPIYRADKSTAVVRIMDDKWNFEYIRNQTLTHMETRFDPLLSFIDFYIYLILGYDADTYQTGGGTPYFQKAYEISNIARGSASDAKGWESSTQGLYSRSQIIDELLNPKFQDFRKAVHIYHFRGLDSLYTEKKLPLRRIFLALDKIGKLREKINQPTIIIRTFFDTKYLEISETFQRSKEPSIYSRIAKIDPEHQKSYDEYDGKRR